jgi:DNA-nicking Smr family endonuclease
MARPPRRTTLTEADLAEWASFTRHVTPLAGRVRPAKPKDDIFEIALTPVTASDTTASSPPAAPPPPPRPSPRSSAGLLVIGAPPGGVDRATWDRLRSGKLAPTRTLDLHGRTVQRAHHALESFLHAAQSERVRCVEVITGRGTGEGGGAIRRELPLWLNLPSIRPLVLAACHPHAANPGAVRLLLRRPR